MDRQIAFVLLERPDVVDVAAVAQAVRTRYPNSSVEVVGASTDGRGAITSSSLRR
jgi:hypothetical protein